MAPCPRSGRSAAPVITAAAVRYLLGLEYPAMGPTLAGPRANPRLLAGRGAGPVRTQCGAESGTQGLVGRALSLDRLVQGLDVAAAEGQGAPALDHLVEEGAPGVHRLGEDLEHHSPVVPVGEDAQLAERFQLRSHRAEAVRQRVVVAGGCGQEAHAVAGDRAHRGGNVVREESDVLDPAAVMSTHELVDLTWVTGGVRLDQGEGHLSGWALYHLRVHCLGAHHYPLLEGLGEAEHLLIAAHGLGELARGQANRNVVH